LYKSSFYKNILRFKSDAETSRGILKEHTSYLLKVWDSSNPELAGIGEAAPLKGLSLDDRDDFEHVITHITSEFDEFDDFILEDFPAIRFALETAMADLENGGKKIIFDTDFYSGKQQIPINGLVWMADKATMAKQIIEKIEAGFDTIKLKIGAIDFEDELDLLKSIRKEFSKKEITIRVDANGAFSKKEAFEKLKRISDYGIHSIEQPIKHGQKEAMAELCSKTPIPIALDEELIGKMSQEEKWELLYLIKPQYVIFKPTLLGGLSATEEWIMLAENLNIGWWITSALESNIGLNAITQFTSKYDVKTPQGLGTGSLYHNNINSPLTVEKGHIFYNPKQSWGGI
jgi:O-succinylbenzoate synthase